MKWMLILGVFLARIQTVQQLVGPHVKIVECPELAQMLVAAVVEEHLLF